MNQVSLGNTGLNHEAVLIAMLYISTRFMNFSLKLQVGDRSTFYWLAPEIPCVDVKRASSKHGNMSLFGQLQEDCPS